MTKTPAYVIGMLLSFLCVSGVYYGSMAIILQEASRVIMSF